MKTNTTHQIYFSATGTTKAIVKMIADKLGNSSKVNDLLTNPQNEGVLLAADDLAVVGAPVYAGRVPAVVTESLKHFKGEGTPAIALVAYGNRDYDDALLELVNTLTENGFVVIGAGAFIAQHSIFPVVGEGRPDESDCKLISGFAETCADKLAAWDGNSKISLSVKGNFPYKEAKAVPLKPSGDKKCTACGICVKLCPKGAIPSDNPIQTIAERCISCAACVAACPEHSRDFHGAVYSGAKLAFKAANSKRREPEIF